MDVPSFLPIILTPAQTRVAHELCAGLTNKEIAQKLGLSVATIKNHVSSILQRSGFPSRGRFIASRNFPLPDAPSDQG